MADLATVADDALIMPHNVFNGEELDNKFPPLQVPPDENLDDVQNDYDDATLQKGMHIAKEINEETLRHGRMRKPPADAPANSDTTTAGTELPCHASPRERLQAILALARERRTPARGTQGPRAAANHTTAQQTPTTPWPCRATSNDDGKLQANTAVMATSRPSEDATLCALRYTPAVDASAYDLLLAGFSVMAGASSPPPRRSAKCCHALGALSRAERTEGTERTESLSSGARGGGPEKGLQSRVESSLSSISVL